MQFRCPNCQHPIRVNETEATGSHEVVDSIECPSCHSRFSLSSDTRSTVVPVAGMKVGHFEIIELLGEGAYGTVFKAWDPELSRHVAIKIPREHRLTAETSKLFLREARAAAAISHPNVVPVFELGQHGDSYYIATEFIDGITLAEYLRDHSMSPRVAVEFVIKLLRAVQVFHDKGIIHRDLKPGNVLLDAQNEPHIADFGLARQETPGEMTVTQSGRIVGTLAYMPPEQARGEIRSVSNRSDIYSMGVVLYELLTGQKPFKASNSRTLVHAILTEDPQPLRRVKPEMPRDLDTICEVAMRKDPSRRYETASEMADDLQRFLDQRPIRRRPVGPAEKLLKWTRRNVVPVLASLMVLIAFGAVGMAWLRPPAGALMAEIETVPPYGRVSFIRYDPLLRVPHLSGFTAETNSGAEVWLLPGLYKVRAEDADGRHHEVWRTIPQTNKAAPFNAHYPHESFEVAGNGTIILPPVRLFAEDEIADSLVRVAGGTFAAGYQAFGESAARHSQTVDDFWVAVNEVSYGQFRRVMQQPKPPDNRVTWLAFLNRFYGDRSQIPDDQPVSGYPIEVALLYCELAGVRLPTNIEYEYVATQQGTTSFPSGESPPVAAVNDWSVPSATEPTPDSSPQGIRNLYFGLAEYTDSTLFHYAMLFPDAFPDQPVREIPGTAVMQRLICELRGAPPNWVFQNTEPDVMNVRRRFSLSPSLQVSPESGPTTEELQRAMDSDAAEQLKRVGWRAYRSVGRN